MLEDKVSGNKALVKADKEDKKIFIWVSGREQTRRIFLGVIRSNFDYIHETIPGIEPEEKVPLQDHPEIVVDYKHLLNLEEMGEESLIPEGVMKRYSVKQLLNGVEPEEERRERRLDRAEITAGRDVIIVEGDHSAIHTHNPYQ
ncbi:MAG: hypothetical protein U9Q68_04445 [Euryarchaeota archaeon]|nr:hypothetical protein [Euryarchaeota archaeon]